MPVGARRARLANGVGILPLWITSGEGGKYQSEVPPRIASNVLELNVVLILTYSKGASRVIHHV